MSTNVTIEVSVIVVNYNAGKYLGPCINDLRESDTPIELIVVDNGSTDSSRSIFNQGASRPNEKYIQNATNLGFAAAVNIGASFAEGKHLAVLNPDCLVLPHTVRTISTFLDRHPDVGLAGGLVFGFHGNEQAGCRRHDPTLLRSVGKALGKIIPLIQFPTIDMTLEKLPDAATDVDAVSGSFFAIPKVVFDGIGGMDQGYFLHFEDLDICRRVRESGRRVIFLPHVSVVHVGGASGGVSRFAIAQHKHRSIKTYFRKFSPNNPFERFAIGVLSDLSLSLMRALDNFRATRNLRSEQNNSGMPWQRKKEGNVLIVGLGTPLFLAIVRRLSAMGEHVVAITRRPDKAPGVPNVTWLTENYPRKVPISDWLAVNKVVCLEPVSTLNDYRRVLEGKRLDLVLTFNEATANSTSRRDSQKHHRDLFCVPPVWLRSTIGHAWQVRSTVTYGEDILNITNIINKLGILFRCSTNRSGSKDYCHPVHIDDIAELCAAAVSGVIKTGSNHEFVARGLEEVTAERLIDRMRKEATSRGGIFAGFQFALAQPFAVLPSLWRRRKTLDNGAHDSRSNQEPEESLKGENSLSGFRPRRFYT